MSREVNRQTKKRPEVPDSLAEPLRRVVIAVEWFRAAYPLKENPRENRLLYQQLAEMKRLSIIVKRLAGMGSDRHSGERSATRVPVESTLPQSLR
jgi:hypothetical protein